MIGNVASNLNRQCQKQPDFKWRNWKIGGENLGYTKFGISRSFREIVESCSLDLK
jgi:hypothetical protein